MCRFFGRCALVIAFTLAPCAMAQSTATITGTITDASGASIPAARIVVHNMGTGEERAAVSDSAGVYVLPSLPVGTYRVTVASPGMQSMAANDIPLEVGQTVQQNFALHVASSSETVEVSASAPAVSAETVTVGAVMDQRTVQEIPLNGRHFLDMGFLIPGSVTPPQNANLAAPLRGQGFFGFNTAGAREDAVNFMVNGINLNDFGGGNQITFQPTVATIREFTVDNSTYSPEYGRNSGGIVNIATRSGTNQWHGELYEYLRNNDLDARNFGNPAGIQAQAPFRRNQFGGDGGGPIRHDKTFFYVSYEGVRHRQGVPLQATVLSPAQRAQAQASGDAVIQKLLPLIPLPNSAGNVYLSTAVAPVNIDQGTANVSHSFNDSHRINLYFAFQADLRNEPPSTSGNNIVGYGDTRQGHRQIFTFNDTKVFSSSLVNEARFGYNRLHLPFNPQTTLTSTEFGISNGVTNFPQITVSGAFSFGGISGEPSLRGDYTAVLSDTLNWIHGKHSVKFGGEFRRADSNINGYTPGAFTFSSITAFINDQATGFTANSSDGASRSFTDALGFFVQDSYKVARTFLLQLGMRYDWNGTPVEAENRFVVFDPTTVSLLQVGKQLGAAYNQSAKNFEPRIGFAWDPFGNSKTVVRSAYAIQTDQPSSSLITPIARNPPFAFPISFSPSASVPYVTFSDAYSLAGGSVSPTSIAHNYKDGYAQSWNLNIQRELASGLSLMTGYFGMKGTDLNIARNYNQPINGVRPYLALSPSSPIFPGQPLANIIVYESDGNSSYNGLWVSGTKRFSSGLVLQTSYTLSKSIDYNSRNFQGLTVQDSYNIRGDRGLSDFDARNRFVMNAIYDLPFKGNRFVQGWEIATIVTVQSGNPMNFVTTNRTFNGSGTLRASVTGPVPVGFIPANNGNAASIGYLDNPMVFYDQGNAFGNLGRNTLIGPGFANVDLGLAKNIKINERFRLQIRADAFDALNHPNFGQPVQTVPSALTLGANGQVTGSAGTLGLITNTRFPTGDSGSSRQLQVSLKLQF
jgi:carboxypeptidase family protein